MENAAGTTRSTEEGSLVAISDLHVEATENRRFVQDLRPQNDADWLIVCGDVGELMADVEWGLRTLAQAFEKVLWVPGNHELWTRPDDPCQLRGEARYRHIVELCRALGVITPEDVYPVWHGRGGPVVIAPLFTLYDYSFGRGSKADSLERAHEAGVVCSDEFVLHADPHGSVEDWCAERVRWTGARLAEHDGEAPYVLVSHFPPIREPTERLMYPDFAQWCGTELTADWHRRFNTAAVVYGHLHIPRTTVHDGVPFHEVSLGYPRQWQRRATKPSLRPIVAEGVPA